MQNEPKDQDSIKKATLLIFSLNQINSLRSNANISTAFMRTKTKYKRSNKQHLILRCFQLTDAHSAVNASFSMRVNSILSPHDTTI